MPGLLVESRSRPARRCKAGERLAVIEAMKMENMLLAERDGVVAECSRRGREPRGRPAGFEL